MNIKLLKFICLFQYVWKLNYFFLYLQLRFDLDNGNNFFQYKFLGVEVGSIFVIDERIGDIYVRQKFDREERFFYILRVQVIDIIIGRVVEFEFEFVIRVSDINDNELKFLDEFYEVIVLEMFLEGIVY